MRCRVKLESITLRNTGPFTDGVTVGPLADGLNVLTARNEAGKTTLLIAATRALFDRHNVSGDAMERLRPAGTSLAPDITVIFVTTEGRFKIHKTFLNSPLSELSEDRDGTWHAIADGDAADGKVLELIGGERSGRGASKAEHWGLLRYLWARQGETVDWPAWDDNAGARIRTGLAQVQIDPLVERLADQFRDMQAAQFTSTGRVAKNSPLQQAQQTCERLASELADVRSKMEEIENQSQQLMQLRDELLVRAREKTEADKQADALTETLKQVELLQKDLERFQSDFETAQERLNAVHNEKKTLDEAKAELDKAQKELAEHQSRQKHAQKEEQAAGQALTSLQNDARALRKRIESTRKRETRLHEIQGLRVTERDLETLRKQFTTVRNQQRTIDQLRRKRAALPDVSNRQVIKLEQIDQEIRDLGIRAEAVGLRVALTPKQDVTLVADRDDTEETLDIATGKTETIIATRVLRLHLPEWGDLQIASGAEEAAEIEQRIGARQSALEAELKKCGVTSIDSARTILEQLKDLNKEIKTAETRLVELLENRDDPQSLAADVEEHEAAIEKLRAHLDITKTETALSQAELKAELTVIRTALETEEAAWATLQDATETQSKRLEICGATRFETLTAVNEIKQRIASLTSRAATIEGRHTEGIDKAEESAQTAFVEAKAQLNVARKKMPPDWEKLEARHERALKSAGQAATEHQHLQQKTQRLEAFLEQSGSQGLYSRETRLQESLVSAETECKRIQDHALAARFLAGLIDYRKKAAVSTVLQPLEDQLSATFADITGIHNRRVFLDENLQVAGIGRKREETYAFDQLSQGAREQLLLALRAAVALELAKTGPQLLILDDVLVNTDATRQENVLDFIGNLAQHVQVLIVTCHGERYRGIGENIGIRPN